MPAYNAEMTLEITVSELTDGKRGFLAALPGTF
jgi:hypothetical protein